MKVYNPAALVRVLGKQIKTKNKHQTSSVSRLSILQEIGQAYPVALSKLCPESDNELFLRVQTINLMN